MSDQKRSGRTFAGLILSGVGFNLSYIFARDLYSALFVFYPILLMAFGVSFSYFAARGLPHFRRVHRWKFALLGFAVITPLVLLYNPEWFRAETVFHATLEDDLSRLNLRVRSDGSCTTEAIGMLGFSWVYHGRCGIRDSTIVFRERPYDTDFFPRTASIQGDKLILRYRDGAPDTSFASYFQITQRPKGEVHPAP